MASDVLPDISRHVAHQAYRRGVDDEIGNCGEQPPQVPAQENGEPSALSCLTNV